MKALADQQSFTAHLAASEESLDHAAALGNTQFDHTYERISDVLIAHVPHTLHGLLQQPVKSRVLKHQLQLIALLLN